MDGRLEMPALETFQTYVTIEKWLEHRDPRWRGALHELGDPVVVLTHLQHFGAEAALINSADWTCAYFDALAVVFVPHRHGTSVDFARRHFAESAAPSVPTAKGAAFRELRALYNLAIVSRADASTPWAMRVPLLLHALDRAAIAIREDPDRAGNWVLLGNCHRALAEILNSESRGDSSDPVSLVRLARARFAYEQALRNDEHDATAQRCLKELNVVYRRLVLTHASSPLTMPSVPQEGAGETAALKDREVNTDTEILWNAGPECRRGIASLVECRLAEARQAFGRAVETSPRDAISWYLLAWLAAEEGDGPATLQACRRALECDQLPARQRELRALDELVTNATAARHSLGREHG
jgi:tetratricopeptide (TPR) repeat protein